MADPLPLNDWKHLTCTLSGQTGRIYINGIEMASGSVTVPKNVIRTKNYLGRSNWDRDADANAVFDEVRIWNVARTEAEIQATMNSSLTGKERGYQP